MSVLMLRIAAATASIAVTSCVASAQSAGPWPDKPVRLIVGAAAGGPTDVVARIVANELSGALGQTFVVDNRPGAGHQIGMTAMANAEPDGYTFGVVTTPFVVNPAIYKKMPYETKDLQPVSLLASSPLVLVVHPAVAAKSVGELVALAKAKPGELNMASAGNVTGPHLAGELFRSMAGIKVQHVAYRGGPQATTAVIRGEAQLYFDTPSGVMRRRLFRSRLSCDWNANCATPFSAKAPVAGLSRQVSSRWALLRRILRRS